MTKKILYLTFIVFSFQILSAQKVLMNEENPDTTYAVKKYGVNSAHFFHMYFGLAFVFGEEQVTKFGGTNALTVGLRYKYKIANFLAVGSDVAYQRNRISFPTHNLTNKNYYKSYNLLSDVYIRFNWGHRGDIMGKFLDLGVYGSYTFYNLNHLNENPEDNAHFSKFVYEEHQLSYYNRFNYGFIARLGINQFVLFTQYRYSPIRINKDYRNIPAWTVGIQIALHR